jgi:hypothetical protein
MTWFAPEDRGQGVVRLAPREQADDAQDQEDEAKDEREGRAHLVKGIRGACQPFYLSHL